MRPHYKILLTLALVSFVLPSVAAITGNLHWTMQDMYAAGTCSERWEQCYARTYSASCGRGGCTTAGKAWNGRCGFYFDIIANPASNCPDQNENRTNSSCSHMSPGEVCKVIWCHGGDWAGTGGPQDTPPIYFPSRDGDTIDNISSGFEEVGVGIPIDHMHLFGTSPHSKMYQRNNYRRDFNLSMGVACEANSSVSVCKISGDDCVTDQGVTWISSSPPHRITFDEPGDYNLTLTVEYVCQMDASTYDKCHRPSAGDYNLLRRSTTVTESKIVHVMTGNPPTKPSVDLTPDAPSRNDNLTCTITTPSTDPDGDAVTYVYKWFKDAALQTDLTVSDTTALSVEIDSSLTAEDEEWRCVVAPKDDKGWEGAPDSDSVTIGGCISCACDSGFPEICVIPALTGQDCCWGCLVPSPTTRRADGDGTCEPCESFPCVTDPDCPYNCECDTPNNVCKPTVVIPDCNARLISVPSLCYKGYNTTLNITIGQISACNPVNFSVAVTSVGDCDIDPPHNVTVGDGKENVLNVSVEINGGDHCEMNITLTDLLDGETSSRAILWNTTTEHYCLTAKPLYCPYAIKPPGVTDCKGDLDGSGEINLTDVIILTDYLNGIGMVDEDCADFNSDGEVNITDRICLGLLTEGKIQDYNFWACPSIAIEQDYASLMLNCTKCNCPAGYDCGADEETCELTV